jgi:hypothetical protein
VDLLKTLDHMPVAGAAETQRIDDSLIRMVLSDPHNLDTVYRQARDRVRQLIEADSSSPDVIALAHRRQQVACPVMDRSARPAPSIHRTRWVARPYRGAGLQRVNVCQLRWN